MTTTALCEFTNIFMYLHLPSQLQYQLSLWIDHSYNGQIHVAESNLRWKQGRTKLVLVPVLFRGIQATLNKYWDQV